MPAGRMQMPEMTGKVEKIAEYHPAELPPKAWHIGPSESERDARGLAYFKVGRQGIESIVRHPTTGDVYIRSSDGRTLLHSRLGWALLATEASP